MLLSSVITLRFKKYNSSKHNLKVCVELKFQSMKVYTTNTSKSLVYTKLNQNIGTIYQLKKSTNFHYTHKEENQWYIKITKNR